VKERAKVHLAHFAPIHAVIDTPQQVHVPRDIAYSASPAALRASALV
jgi:hypothetical protein